ncbi:MULTISPECIES: M20/M25/M40 family metallo-hydrolase [unclassified Oceanispirochaeta]|uniref:M20/M25/M40 family metallo-hydrolase n=1 Tax=unclassified Oceanispirochaeta TaxID=2635722 RepID=UPI000E091B20|nr:MULTISPECIES: M20/M25/M40 family metallo-hydrolase [unclassified Oceanispirochaeta]MBF9014895.1 M20/M25/M40 family metallo-hydrolase [Oceanispirochaeta sp. M2]NPD71424.1 M20/M25/M40 family metallo-hydrolase [Oceanispirochaeta sp. M1]RDG33385.1 M20/M25/M40 family metallo-hydrolase [Oceanispirochaeta sp. M1]
MPLIIIILFFLILFIPYLVQKSGSSHPQRPPAEFESGDFPEKLAQLIRIPTVSWTDSEKVDESSLKEFQDTLVKLFPLVHEKMERETPDPYQIMYKWPGKDADKEPVLFLAHYDVVPAEEEGGESWKKPPFSGLIEDGVLWGRGTLDIKSQLGMMMEASERLLKEGFQPERSLYFAFGGDEEVAGARGATKMSAYFKSKGLKFAMVMDEGGVIAENMLSFLGDKPVGLIGLAEKGFVTFKLTAHGDSGHSSMPPAEGTVVTRLARGITRIEKRRQPSLLTTQIKGMLKSFVPHVPLPLGVVFANLWLFNPLIRLIFAGSRTTDSLIRSTQAFTVARAGEQENIIPGEASCMVNHRIVPGDTIEALKKRHEKKLKGLNIKIEDAGNWPSNNPIEPVHGENRGYNWVKETLAETHPEVIPAPFLVNGSTDSKYYRDLTGQIIRFTPLILSKESINSIHGVNEKVSLENLNRALGFYYKLIKKL